MAMRCSRAISRKAGRFLTATAAMMVTSNVNPMSARVMGIMCSRPSRVPV